MFHCHLLAPLSCAYTLPSHLCSKTISGSPRTAGHHQFTHWPAPLCSTLVSCLVSLPEPPPTFMTQHSPLSYRPTCSLLLLVISQVLTLCGAPLAPVLGHIVPVLTNFHSCQIFLCQVPPSPSQNSAGPCFGQAPKKTWLWEPIVLHPGNMSKPFQTASHQFCFYCSLDVSPLLSHCC